MEKKIGAFGAGQFSLETLVGGRPGTTIFQNPGGGGGLGGSHTRTGPGRPPGSTARKHVNPGPIRPRDQTLNWSELVRLGANAWPDKRFCVVGQALAPNVHLIVFTPLPN